jgi:pSer/pThr/pTyr-binding forkhead associated (FHA) protein
MSGSHAAIELGAEGYKVRDMGSTNGTFVNGSPVQAAELKHGDKITVGEHTLQYLLEKKERAGSYDLSDEL